MITRVTHISTAPTTSAMHSKNKGGGNDGSWTARAKRYRISPNLTTNLG